MTVYELFKKVDIYLLADTLKTQHKHYYKKKKKTVKILKLFYNEIESIQKIPLDEEDEDFLIICKPVLDDLGKDFKDASKVKETKLDTYLVVDGIHKNELIAFKDNLDKPWKELFDNKDINMPVAYGIDFVERGRILNYEVSKASLEWYGLYTVAAEIFWEMTFYGLFNCQVEEKKKDLEERVDEVNEMIEKEKNGEDVSDTFESLTELLEDLEEEDDDKKEKPKKTVITLSEQEKTKIRETMYAVSEISFKHTKDLYKRILELDCN